jgi:hypothetical protein
MPATASSHSTPCYGEYREVQTMTLIDFLAAIVGVVYLVGAAVYAGALIAVLRTDHENPVAHRWIAWHAGHWSAHHPGGR